MEFRPCIDIHNGRVKQIVGSTLKDNADSTKENFVAENGAEYYAEIYKKAGLKGGHIILLNPADSPYYQETKDQAIRALSAYPGGLQIGGGINPTNAEAFLKAGASHVIVTSYVFRDGKIQWDRLTEMVSAVGPEHLVLDLSCRKSDDGNYYVVTDRWQKMTKEAMTPGLMSELSGYCDEFLIHAVDVEGKAAGIETSIVNTLADWEGKPVTYAGGVHDYEDLLLLKELGQGKINVTVGSALDLFGGKLSFSHIIELCKG